MLIECNEILCAQISLVNNLSGLCVKFFGYSLVKVIRQSLINRKSLFYLQAIPDGILLPRP